MPAPTYTTLNDLIAAISARIAPNGNEEITGAVHQETLHMVAQSLVAMMGEVLPEVAAAFPAWDAETTYPGGSEVVVTHNGKLYLFLSELDQTAREPGVHALIWKEISALQLAHFVGRDQALDTGGPSEVTAQEIRAHLDQADGKVGRTLFVSTAFGDNATAAIGVATKPYKTIEAAMTAASNGDIIRLTDRTIAFDTYTLNVTKQLTIEGSDTEFLGHIQVQAGAHLRCSGVWPAGVGISLGGVLHARNLHVLDLTVYHGGSCEVRNSHIQNVHTYGPAEFSAYSSTIGVINQSASGTEAGNIGLFSSYVNGSVTLGALSAGLDLSNSTIAENVTFGTADGNLRIFNSTIAGEVLGAVIVEGAGYHIGPGSPSAPTGSMATQDADDVAITGGDISGTEITVSTPTSSGHAANKGYVDAALASLTGKRMNARAATTANININSPGASFDGVSMVAGQLLLVRVQSTASQNGPYVWNGATSPLTRPVDYDTFDEIAGALIIVNEGSTLADTMWLCTANTGGTLGSGALPFTRIRIDIQLPVPIAQGGTGATSAVAARVALGLSNASNLTDGTVSPDRLPLATDVDYGATRFVQDPAELSDRRMENLAIAPAHLQFELGWRYTAKWQQLGSDPPYVSYERNRLDADVTWARVETGRYRLTSSVARFDDSTEVSIVNSSNSYLRVIVESTTQIDIITYNSSWAQADGVSGMVRMAVTSHMPPP